MSFEDGMSQSACNTLAAARLSKPEEGPETINRVIEYSTPAE